MSDGHIRIYERKLGSSRGYVLSEVQGREAADKYLRDIAEFHTERGFGATFNLDGELEVRNKSGKVVSTFWTDPKEEKAERRTVVVVLAGINLADFDLAGIDDPDVQKFLEEVAEGRRPSSLMDEPELLVAFSPDLKELPIVGALVAMADPHDPKLWASSAGMEKTDRAMGVARELIQERLPWIEVDEDEGLELYLAVVDEKTVR